MFCQDLCSYWDIPASGNLVLSGCMHVSGFACIEKKADSRMHAQKSIAGCMLVFGYASFSKERREEQRGDVEEYLVHCDCGLKGQTMTL